MASNACTALAALILTTSAMANAAPIVVPTFSLDLAPGYSGQFASIVSSNAAETVLSLDIPDDGLHLTASGGNPQSEYFGSFAALNAAEGYRVTGIRFTASVTGSFQAGQPPAGATNIRYGDAGNRFGIYFGMDSAPGAYIYQESYLTEETIDITVPISNSGSPLDFQFEIAATAWGYATYFIPYNPTPGIPDPDWDSASDKVYGRGQIDVWNPQLTIYTEALPVPEPATYAMFAAGMLVVLGARRRRKAGCKM